MQPVPDSSMSLPPTSVYADPGRVPELALPGNHTLACPECGHQVQGQNLDIENVL